MSCTVFPLLGKIHLFPQVLTFEATFISCIVVADHGVVVVGRFAIGLYALWGYFFVFLQSLTPRLAG